MNTTIEVENIPVKRTNQVKVICKCYAYGNCYKLESESFDNPTDLLTHEQMIEKLKQHVYVGINLITVKELIDNRDKDKPFQLQTTGHFIVFGDEGVYINKPMEVNSEQ